MPTNGGKMKPSGKIMESGRIYLCYLSPEMVTERYVGWLNDPEVNQYTEARWGAPYTLEGTRQFVKAQWDDPNTHMFAIMLKVQRTSSSVSPSPEDLKKGDRHIGNIKVGPISAKHNFAEIGIIIGEKDMWGKGIATEAIEMLTKYSFEKLKIHKLIAGCYAPNKGSEKAFLKAGYEREGIVKGKFRSGERYVDDIIFGKTNS